MTSPVAAYSYLPVTLDPDVVHRYADTGDNETACGLISPWVKNIMLITDKFTWCPTCYPPSFFHPELGEIIGYATIEEFEAAPRELGGFLMEIYAATVRAGDVVTGIWSSFRHRYDPELFRVHGLDIWTSPNGVRMATIHTGPQAWERRSYCADTVIRIKEETRQ